MRVWRRANLAEILVLDGMLSLVRHQRVMFDAPDDAIEHLRLVRGVLPCLEVVTGKGANRPLRHDHHPTPVHDISVILSAQAVWSFVTTTTSPAACCSCPCAHG